MKAVVVSGTLKGNYNDVNDLVEKAKELNIQIGLTKDLSEIRIRGGLVCDARLDNQPTFKGYCGPMLDGGCLRYETWEVYDLMSN